MGSKQRWALIALCSAVLIIAIDNTILNVALPTMAEATGASNSQLQWIVDAYSLVYACLMLTCGSLADRLGRRRVLMVGLTLFGAASGVAALSSSPGTLIACRAAMGVGAACVAPVALSLLTNVFVEPRERAKAIGVWAAVASIGVAVGPVVGGLLLAHFWWGSVFLVNVPIAVALVLVAPLAIPESKHHDGSPVDLPGVVLSVFALMSLLWATIEATNRGWDDPAILTSLGLSLVLGAAFVVWELRCAHPMVDLRLFDDARFSASTSVNALNTFAASGTLFVLSQLLQFGMGFTPLQAGLRMAPMAATMAIASATSERLVARIGARTVVSLGMGLVAVSCLLMARFDQDSSFLAIVMVTLIFGIGSGFSFAPTMAVAMSVVPKEQAGAASGTVNTVRQVGLALGIALMGSVLATSFGRHVRSESAGLALSGEQLQRAAESTGSAVDIAGRIGGARGASVLEVARDAFVRGAGVALVLAALVSVIGVGLSQRFIPRRPPRLGEQAEQVAGAIGLSPVGDPG